MLCLNTCQFFILIYQNYLLIYYQTILSIHYGLLLVIKYFLTSKFNFFFFYNTYRKEILLKNIKTSFKIWTNRIYLLGAPS